MNVTVRLVFVLLLILVLAEAQYRMMANSGPAWRQKLWRKTRMAPAFEDDFSSGLDKVEQDSTLIDMLAN